MSKLLSVPGHATSSGWLHFSFKYARDRHRSWSDRHMLVLELEYQELEYDNGNDLSSLCLDVFS